MRKTRLTLVAAVATALMAAGPAQAQLSTPQPVTGTTISSLAIGAATPALLTNFGPNRTATSAPSLLTVIATGGWSVSAADAANDGHLIKNPLTPQCASSAGQTANQLQVLSSDNTASTIGPVAHQAQQVVDATASQVASGSLANAFDVSYSINLGAAEQLAALCDYSTTVTWTVQ